MANLAWITLDNENELNDRLRQRIQNRMRTSCHYQPRDGAQPTTDWSVFHDMPRRPKQLAAPERNESGKRALASTERDNGFRQQVCWYWGSGEDGWKLGEGCSKTWRGRFEKLTLNPPASTPKMRYAAIRPSVPMRRYAKATSTVVIRSAYPQNSAATHRK